MQITTTLASAPTRSSVAIHGMGLYTLKSMEIIIKLHLMHSSVSEALLSRQKVLASMSSLELYHDLKHYQEEDAVSVQTRVN